MHVCAGCICTKRFKDAITRSTSTYLPLTDDRLFGNFSGAEAVGVEAVSVEAMVAKTVGVGSLMWRSLLWRSLVWSVFILMAVGLSRLSFYTSYCEGRWTQDP